MVCSSLWIHGWGFDWQAQEIPLHDTFYYAESKLRLAAPVVTGAILLLLARPLAGFITKGLS